MKMFTVKTRYHCRRRPQHRITNRCTAETIFKFRYVISRVPKGRRGFNSPDVHKNRLLCRVHTSVMRSSELKQRCSPRYDKLCHKILSPKNLRRRILIRRYLNNARNTASQNERLYLYLICNLQMSNIISHNC